MSAALAFAVAVVAGLGMVAVVLAVFRKGDIERVARECAMAAVSKEREAVHRVLILNATALRRSGRRQHAKVVDELLGLLKARPMQLEVSVSLSKGAHNAKDQAIREAARALG